jgi:hypothetical protein
MKSSSLAKDLISLSAECILINIPELTGRMLGSLLVFKDQTFNG